MDNNFQQKNERSGRVSFVFFVLAGVVLIAADQWIKQAVNQQHVFRNNAFAFSLPLPTWLIFVIYLTVMAAMVIHCAKNYHRFTRLQSAAWILIFAGAISNIFERVALGYVRDFIYVHFSKWTGIYNLADMYIILGILILLFEGFYKKSKPNLL